MQTKRVEECAFEEGEVYLFHRSDAACPREGSMWGIFNRRDDDGIHLEIQTRDCDCFQYWQLLPTSYRYCRPATREEERYFFTEQIRAECLANRFRR